MSAPGIWTLGGTQGPAGPTGPTGATGAAGAAGHGATTTTGAITFGSGHYTLPVTDGTAFPNGTIVFISDGTNSLVGTVLSGGGTTSLVVNPITVTGTPTSIPNGTTLTFSGQTGATGPAGSVTSNFRTQIAALSPTRWYQNTNAGNNNTETDHGSDGRDGTWSSSGSSAVRGMILGQAGNAALLDGTAGRLDFPTTGLPTGAASWSVVHVATLYDKSAAGVHSFWGIGPLTSAHGFTLDFSSSLFEMNATPGFFTIGWQDVAMIDGGEPYLATTTYDGVTLRQYLWSRFIFSAATTLNLTYALGKGSIGASGDGTPIQFSKIVSADWAMFSGTTLTPAQIYNLAAALAGN